IAGSGPNHRWSGLAAELRTWVGRLVERVSPRLASLFPPLPGNRQEVPDRYLWFRQWRCAACNVVAPIESALPIAARTIRQVVFISWNEGRAVPTIQGEAGGKRTRGKWTCPACGVTQSIAGMGASEPSVLMAIRLKTHGRPAIVTVPPG